MNNISLYRIMILALVLALSVTVSFAQQIPVSIPGGDQDFPRVAPPSPTRGGNMNPRMYPPPTRGDNRNPSMYTPPSVNKCGPPAPPICFPCPPPVCKSTNMGSSVYLGYLYSNGAGFQIQLNNPNATGLTSTRGDFNLQGLWMELGATIDVCQNVTAVFTGAHLFSLQSNTTQSYTIAGSPSAARQWNSDVQWWEVNSAGTYQFCPGISAIAGFRWTSFAVNFNNARNQQNFNALNDSATLTTNLYIPYSGLLLESSPDCQSTFKLAAYGCPVLPGTFAFSETMSLANPTTLSPNVNLNSGYFVEALSEYSMRRDMWNFGGFVRFTAVFSERSVGLTLGGVNTPMDFTFEKKNWIFGGKIGYKF